MKLMRTTLIMAATALTFASATTVDARACGKRLTRTQGAAVGAIGGAVLGGVLTHGSTGPLVGAAAGGIAGHQVAQHNNRKNCGRYYRRSRR
jgi:osmotically inducible lipoprotein OsmB